MFDATVGISTKSAGGINTLSITCMIPFDAITSAVTTVASLTMTVSLTVKVTSSPFTIVAVIPSVTSEEATDPEYTW